MSTLAEAEFYADGGFDDILFSIPISAVRAFVNEMLMVSLISMNQDKFKRSAALLHKLEHFQILVDNLEILHELAAFPTTKPWAIWIKIDCGTHRGMCAHALTRALTVTAAGLQPTDLLALELAKAIAASPNCKLAGS